ncbi:MAG TPA: hypothetical protein VIO37_11635 [Candidatus Dormibacteraeota bacterium]|jgi:hypothetical protein
MAFLIFIVILPVLCTWGGAALLAAAFRRSGRPRLLMIAGAIVSLLITGLWIFVIADRNDYSAIVSIYVLVIASAAALVAAGVLVLKPPTARRVAALLLVTAYPLSLLALLLAGSWVGTGIFPVKVTTGP